MTSENIKKSVNAAADDVSDLTDGAAAKASEGASSISGQAKDGFGKVVNAAGDLYARGADQARNAMDDLPASLSDASAAGENLAHTSRRRITSGVRTQPVEALLLAGAIGYLVGWATNRG